MDYKNADRAIKDMNRKNLRAFNGLKLLKFDELNVLRAVKKVYEESIRQAKRWYRQIAMAAYEAALVLAGTDKRKAQREAEDWVSDDWVLDLLEDYDPITLYKFTTEADRKRDKLVEALLSTPNRAAEIDRALRYWSQQVAEYADEAVWDATVEGFKDGGVTKVRWITEQDSRVCSECKHRHGKVYDIDKVPTKPHIRCRCTVVPVID